MMNQEMSTLTACASTVAQAAPLAPRWKPQTKSRSAPILTMQARATVIRGTLESPSPRKMAPSRL